MLTMITGFFGNFKNIIMAVGAALIGGYVLKQKYNAYKAEDKLKTIEHKIAKTNVVIAKDTAKAKAKATNLEHGAEVKVLRQLKEERKKVLKEMDDIEDLIEKTQVEKKAVKGRTRGKKVTIKG